MTGFYCPYGTGENLQMCPAGTYNPVEGIAAESDCTQCDPGSYCQYPGLSNYTGLCAPGYYCTIGKFCSTWALGMPYLTDLLNLKLDGVVDARNYVRNSVSQRASRLGLERTILSI